MSEPAPQAPVSTTGPLWRVTLIGIGCGALWIATSVWLRPAGEAVTLGGIAAMVLPLLMIGLATQLGRTLVVLRAEAAGLRQDLELLRTTQGDAHARAPSDDAFAENRVAPAAQAPPASASAAQPAAPQGRLALEPERTEEPPLTTEELISALQFPETPEDRIGFRALRRAMQDHRASLIIQAAQDVLTLLSQDGIYMDDLQPDHARPDLWRRFAQGERGGQIAEVGGIRDPEVLDVCAMRLRENAVYRDAVHHFVRRFDMYFRDLEPDLSDQEIAQFTDTRSARAFILLGRAMGVFG